MVCRSQGELPSDFCTLLKCTDYGNSLTLDQVVFDRRGKEERSVKASLLFRGSGDANKEECDSKEK
jgi:hypothetical protein